MKEVRRAIIDCDPGIDDALALLLALASKGLEVKAITTVTGNVDVEQTTANLLKVLSVSRIQDMPRVGKGSALPLSSRALEARYVHGSDGLGETNLPEPTINPKIEDGVELVSSLSDSCDTLIATGPLTNVARAIRRDAGLPRRFESVFIMGGALRVPGNINEYAEFNICSDPDAAKAVFSSAMPITLVSLDVTQKVVLTERHLEEISGRNQELVDFIKHIARFSMNFHRCKRGIDGAYMHDPLAVGLSIDESICGYEKLSLDVDTRRQRGRLIEKNGRRNVRFARDVRPERFFELFINMLNRICDKS